MHASPASPCFWCLTPAPATPARDLQETQGGSVSQAQPTAEVDQGPPATTNDERLRPTEARPATAGPMPSPIYSDKDAKKAAQSARRAARRAAAEAAPVAAQVFSAQVSVLNEPRPSHPDCTPPPPPTRPPCCQPCQPLFLVPHPSSCHPSL
jgi:hypothetical protein